LDFISFRRGHLDVSPPSASCSTLLDVLGSSYALSYNIEFAHVLKA